MISMEGFPLFPKLQRILALSVLLMLGNTSDVASNEITPAAPHLMPVQKNRVLNAKLTSFSSATVTNEIPTVQLENPSADGYLFSPTNLHLHADAHDVDGTISSVQFFYEPLFGDRELLGEARQEPYDLNIPNFVGTDGTLLAVATDNLGSTNSSSVLLQIRGVEGDDLYRPYVVSGAHVVSYANNSQAGLQKREPDLALLSRTVWWQWTAPTNGIACISTEGSSFDTVLRVYLPGPFQPYGPIAFNDDSGFAPASQVKALVEEGTTYLITVKGLRTNEAGNIVLHIDLKEPVTSADPPPSNDAPENADLITGSDVIIHSTNRGATAEAGRPLDEKTVWFKWRSPADGRVLMTTEESDFDTELTVYAVPSSTETTRLNLNDDSVGLTSDLALTTTSNMDYLILVYGNGGTEGNLQLNLKFSSPVDAPPPNDNFADRTRVSGDYLFLRGRTTHASIEQGEPVLQEDSLLHQSVWWAWTPSRSGWVTITTRIHNTTFNPYNDFVDMPTGVFQGTNLSTLQLVASGGYVKSYTDFKWQINFWANEGEEYEILVSAFGLTTEQLELIINQREDHSEFAFDAPHRLGDSISAELHSFHRNVYIESSTDLINWTPLSEKIVVEGTNSVSLPVSGSKTIFFRGLSYE
jgi:hypothetical protein